MDRQQWNRIVLSVSVQILLLFSACNKTDCDTPVAVDAGPEWRYLGLGDFPLADIVVDPNDDQILYAARVRPSSPEPEAPRLFRTLDGGEHWDSLETDLSGWILSLDIFNGSGVLYAAGNFPEGPLVSSSDSGDTWEAVDITGVSLNAGDFGSLVRSNPDLPGVQFLGTSDGDTLGGLFRRNSPDAPWTPMLLEHGETMAVSDLTFSGPNGEWMGAAPWVDSILCYSYDGGDTWQSLSNPDTAYRVLSVLVDPSDRYRIYAGCLWPGLLETTDGGATWMNHPELPYDHGAMRLRLISDIPVLRTLQWDAPYQWSTRLFTRIGGEWVELGDGLPFISESELYVSPLCDVLIYGYGIHLLLE